MNLYDFAMECCKKYAKAKPSSDRIDLENYQALDMCPFCQVQLEEITSKKGNTYLANPDKSPHRKSYVCVYSWQEFKGVPDIKHKQPIRKENTPDYIEPPYVEL